MKKPYKKRRFIVFQKIQSLFALYIVISISLVSIFLCYELLCSFFTSFGFSLPRNELFTYLENPLFVRTAVLLIWTFICYNLSVFLTTNKIIGPLVYFYRILDSLIKGDYTVKAKFKNRDYYYKDIEQQLNELIETLAQKKEEKNKLLLDTEKKLFELGYDLTTKNLPDRTIDLLVKAKENIEECKKL